MTTTTLLDRDSFEAAVTALPDEVPVALALTDIDEFAPLNESLGHAAGDAVLRSFERTLTGSVPGGALVGRVSGDGYAVALPGTSAESALILLEEIRAHFGSREPAPEVPRLVQVSVGIAARPQHARTYPELIRAADEALFRAKREGRDRVAIYVEDRMTLKSNYYPKASLEQLSKLSAKSGRTEASLLREALDDLVAKYAGEL
ncbi:MAG: GGDEF domain-containing protein [Gaiellaceae bacterium]